MFKMAVLRFLFAHLFSMILQTTAESIANEKLVCSGSVAVGTILSSSGAYYAISDKPQSASGECSCDHSTSQLDCKVAPEFPVSAPQGPAVCQPAGQTTCAIPNISLCQEGKLIGGLNSDGGFYVTGQSDKASGYCQCDLRGAEWLLRCPDYPTSSSFKPFSQKYIHCSKKPDCKGF